MELDAQRLARALAAAGTGVWQWDTATGLVTWSATLDELVGSDGEDHDGGIDAVIELVDASDRPRFGEALRTALRARSGFDVAHRIRRRDGQVRWVHTHGVVAVEEDGAAVVVGAVVDVSSRRQAEARLAAVSERNRIVVDDLSRTLDELIDLAQHDRSESLDDVVSRLARAVEALEQS